MPKPGSRRRVTAARSTRSCGLAQARSAKVARFVRDSGSQEWLLRLFVQHASCSLVVQENSGLDV